MINKIARVARNKIWFLLRNIAAGFQVPKLNEMNHGVFTTRGLRRSELACFLEIYSELNAGAKLGLVRKIIYWLLGERLCVIVIGSNSGTDANHEMLGFNMFYFNSRDFEEDTIHSGFIGTKTEARGLGVATAMQQHIFSNFAKTNLKGVSSRISVNNHSSMAVAKKVGLEPVEQYFDESMGEERFYLVCDLSKYR